jgi:hypothetical protein
VVFKSVRRTPGRVFTWAAIHRDSPGSPGKVIKDIHFRSGDRHASFSQSLHIGSNTLDTKPEKPVKRRDRQPSFQRQF